MTWTNVCNPPDDCRTVLFLMADGTQVQGFYWRIEGLWYPRVGSKRRKNAINPVGWREIEVPAGTEDDR